jgi:hypothetical protein
MYGVAAALSGDVTGFVPERRRHDREPDARGDDEDRGEGQLAAGERPDQPVLLPLVGEGGTLLGRGDVRHRRS